MIKTERLILRQWRESDFAPFAKLNGDPRVREFFPSLLTPEESDNLAKYAMKKIEEQGWGFWAVEAPGVADFIGFVGLANVDFTAPFTPAVEIGWRLAFEFWGQGYAFEAAKAALDYGFKTLYLPEIVAFTTLHNHRSRRLMEKLGMSHNEADDFNHPKLPEDHPLSRHVLYRLKQI
jgi:3-dehydroquinate dehydratase/shikimate dehydrogenase